MMSQRNGNLVLSRKLHEVVQIGEGIEIEIAQIRGGAVKLAIRAPREVKVVRQELTVGERPRAA